VIGSHRPPAALRVPACKRTLDCVSPFGQYLFVRNRNRRITTSMVETLQGRGWKGQVEAVNFCHLGASVAAVLRLRLRLRDNVRVAVMSEGDSPTDHHGRICLDVRGGGLKLDHTADDDTDFDMVTGAAVQLSLESEVGPNVA